MAAAPSQPRVFGLSCVHQLSVSLSHHAGRVWTEYSKTRRCFGQRVFARVALEQSVGVLRAREWPLMKTNGSLAVTKAQLLLAVKTVVTPTAPQTAGRSVGGPGAQPTELSAEGLKVD